MSTSVSYPASTTYPDSPFPYSPIVRVGDVLYLSGIASTDAKGAIIPGDFADEFRQAISNLKNILAGVGCDLSHVIQTRNYVRDSANLPLFNQLYREFFSPPFPTRTTITDCLPANLHYEIEAIAVAPPRD